MMRNGLSQANSLSHPFAVCGDFALRYLRHAGALQGFIGELRCLVAREPMKTQWPVNKVVAIGAWRKGVELCAVSDLPEKLDGLLRSEAEDTDRALRGLDQTGH